ncbi:MAG: alpha/beta fold hydrolase [Opitutaceae bacterium]
MRFRYLIGLWVLLVLVSTGYRSYRGFELQMSADQEVSLVKVDPATATGGTVELAYRELHSQATASSPILLLHGNPMAGSALLPLANELGSERSILIPDLPGLGVSGRNVHAYSSEHQVSVLLNWLDLRGIQAVHLVGYSQGSAVALEFADRAPERTQSVSLIAGVGLQEHELLGRYEWNQPIYTAYYAGLWSLRWLTPHFGLFDTAFLAPSTAQNFAHTDLRRNAAFIERLAKPALILHSVDDRLVPFRAAKAHAELLPQARFYELPGGHMGIFSDTRAYADALLPFLSDVDAGAAKDRSRALANGRAEQPAAKVALPERPPMAQSWMFALFLVIFVFFSEDLACIIGGILAASGVMSLPAAVVGCFLGIFVSDIGLYLIGRFLGDRAMRIGFIAKACEGNSFARLKSGFERKGLQVVFLTRFIPGSRVPAYTSAGVLKLPFLRFCIWLALAAALWTPILVSLAYIFGKPLIKWWEQSGAIVLPLVALGLVAFYMGLHLLTASLTYRGRRGIRGRWVRLTQWEFWPAWPVYAPVVVYCVYLAVRHRSLTVWAACNPGMHPASGLALESKSEILACLNGETGCVADWERIKPSTTLEERLGALGEFRAQYQLEYPIVLKPDIGQRGEGVAVIHSQSQAESYLEQNAECVIAQRFIPGAEFGVFMVRDSKGAFKLFSITEKVLPELVGDGEQTLERLILEDPRAVALAKHYMKVNRERLYDIPAVDEKIQLVELGTHCRGAVFLDGNRYKSDALLAKLTEVLSSYEGFSFGRFDLRIPSGEDLMAGKNIQILELNGVSSESTDIYDPKNSIFHAWKVLCLQWRIAFEIGAVNRAKGVAVPTLKDILTVLRGHRERSPYEVE